MTKLEEKKVQCHCADCGRSVWLYPSEIPFAYDFVCKECKQYEQNYVKEMNKEQEEFLRKEEPYLYD